MGSHHVNAEEGVGPGGEIVLKWPHRHSETHGRWRSLHVGGVKFGVIIPEHDRRDTTWCAQSYGPHPNEFFGEINTMSGFGTQWAAVVFLIRHNGYWLRDEKQARADRERWQLRLEQQIKGEQ